MSQGAAMSLLYFKDFFTIGSIVSGFVGSLLAINGSLDFACYSMLVSFGFDVADGSIARLTGRANSFGKNFDNVADLIPYSVAPAFIVFAYLSDLELPRQLRWAAISLFPRTGVSPQLIFAAVIGAFPLVTGCLRLARNQTYPVQSDGFDLGLSRPASALLITGVVGNHFAQQALYALLAPIAIVVISYLNLAYTPFVTNKGPRFSLPVKFVLCISCLLLLASVVVTLLTREPYCMDLLLIFMTLYLFSGCIYTTPGQRRHFRSLAHNSRAPERSP
jgi:CDP-diacylglycerol--serine O-phosphatidyltransferase